MSMRMGIIIRRMGLAAGYLLYTAVVLAVLLYVRFPDETVRLWIQNRINSSQHLVTCQIRKLRPTWTGGLNFSDIVLKAGNSQDLGLMKIDSLRVRPQLLRWVSGTRAVQFAGKGHGGETHGTISLDQRKKRGRLTMRVQKVDIASFTDLLTLMRRKASGTLAGDFSLTAGADLLTTATGDADITVTNGVIGLQKELFGLGELEFSSLTSKAKLADRMIRILSGRLDSRVLSGKFGGELRLASDPRLTTLLLKGTLSPRPELFTKLKGKEEVDLMRGQLKDGKMPFTISGTVLEPGITFTDSGS